MTLWAGRNNGDDLQRIKSIIAEYPGKAPVLLHIQNGAGKRATIEMADEFLVNPNPALSRELAAYMS